MANKVTIDVEARFIDDVTDDAKDAQKAIDNIGKEAKDTQKDLDKLGKKKVKPTVDADSSKFLKKIRDAEAKAKKFGKTKTAAVLSVVDKASTVLAKVTGKAKSFANKVFSGVVKVKDIATDVLTKVSGLGKSIAGRTWTAIVKVKDLATAPLRKLKDSLFSIKTLIAGLATGFAVKAAVSTPVGYADSIESSRIAFESKLGSASAAEKFLQDIYKFDEKSPFDTMEIVGITQQMMNLGWTAENVLDDLGTIGDWSASLGKGEEGISSVTRALGQMRMKGKLSAEEMLQLTEAGVSAWQYLADYMGKDISTIREMAEDGAIDVDTAIKAIMTGMGEYTGAAASLADRTVSGLKDQISSLFKTYVMLPWGEGLAEGFKDALVDVRDIIDENKDSLKKFGETAKDVGKLISGWLADRIENTVKRFKDITESDAFQKGSLTEKINMLWDGVIANPFSNWWNETVVPWWDATVVPWLAEKAKSIGEGIGSGLTNGIATLLGLDVSGAVEDGKTIGGSFMEGFLEGFDTSKIWDALKQWASDHKGLAAGLGVILGGKILSGLGGALGNIMTLFGGGSGGSGGLGSSSVGTMTVNAAVVNINGGLGNGGTPDVDLPNGNGNGDTYVGGGGFFRRLIGSTGNNMVKGTGISGALASLGFKLTGGPAASAITSGGAAAALGGASVLGGVGGALGIGSGIWDIIKGAKSSGKDAKDKYFSGGTKLGMVGTGAAAGAAIGSVIPVVGTAAGALIGAGVGGAGALLGGTKVGKWLSDATDKGGVLNNAWQSTKGWVGEKKDKVTNWAKKKYYGDAYDEETGQVDMGWMGDTGGWIDKVNSVKKFFTETIPEKWDELWDGISNFFTDTIPSALEAAGESISKFFTETIPEKWNEFWDGVGEFFTETIPDALETAGEGISKFFTETIPEKWGEFWDEVGNFFSETVPYALGYVTGKIYTFFSETVPQFFSDLWDTVATFFMETLPDWADGIWNDHVMPFFTETIPQFFSDLWNSIATFFTETLPDWAEGIWDDHILPFFTETIPGFFASLWSSIATFFTETLPEWAEGIWNDHIYPFFTETVPSFFASLWSTITTFFTETLPEWAEGIWNGHILPFFTETIPGFFLMLWNAISTFFTETIPEWAENIWNNNVVPFFTETLPGFFGDIWDSVTGFFNDSIDFIAESIWAPIKSFFTETIPGWASSAISKVKEWWGGVKDNFMSGFSAGSGEEGGNARGNIIHPAGSNAPGYAAGGMVRGGARLVKVAEEGTPEMIIPLGSQRRERGLKLWYKAGEMLGVPGYARGGMTMGSSSDEGIRFNRYDNNEPVSTTTEVDVGGIKVEINVNASGGTNSIVDAIKEQVDEIVEVVAGAMNEALGAQFANTPLRGRA